MFFSLNSFYIIFIISTFALMIRHIPFVPTLIATGFGAGFWPWGPGTMGALVATLLWMGASFWLDAVSLAWVTLAAAVVFTSLGTWATHKLQPFWGDAPPVWLSTRWLESGFRSSCAPRATGSLRRWRLSFSGFLISSNHWVSVPLTVAVALSGLWPTIFWLASILFSSCYW